MKTIEDRLTTVVSLLPPAAQPRFAASLVVGQSANSRLVEAVQALAKTQGLICYTKEELVRARAKMLPPVAHPESSQDEAASLAARFAACETPHAQTAFWRGLTAWERTVLTRASRSLAPQSSPRHSSRACADRPAMSGLAHQIR